MGSRRAQTSKEASMSEKSVWMGRSCVVGLASLAVGGSVFAQGPAQGTEGVDDSAPREPLAYVEYGADPNRFGFKLLLDGGEPFARGLLEISGKGVAEAVRLPIELDEAGGWSRTWRDTPLAGSVTASFKVLAASQVVVSTKVKIQPFQQEAKSPMQSGEIIIREIMKDPSFVTDSKGEWFEIVNTTNHPIDLRQWVIDDHGSNHHVIGASSPLAINLFPGVPFVLANNADSATNGGVTVGYKYSSFSLTNGSDRIALYDPSGVLADLVAYDDGVFWPDTAGRALNLRATVFDAVHADDPAMWCDATTQISVTNTDRGTPVANNTSCP
jgi:hypothetical protein